MRTLGTNDWMVLNNIIYQMNATDDLKAMRENFLIQMKLVLEFDSADFYIIKDTKNHTLTSPVYCNHTIRMDTNAEDKWEGIENSRGFMYGGKSQVYRESDILSEEKRVETKYYKEFFAPYHLHYAVTMILARKNQFLGIVTFYRTREQEDFAYEDLLILDILKEHLALRLYKELQTESESDDKVTVHQCVTLYNLTKREETILRRLMDGDENDKICSELAITNNTLKKHILNIYKKLGISNRVQMFKMIRERE
ncbi:helix-turn-helix transcriptional regulator [Velocimicrobium porci]|uniref:Helix-turn-helix transcriptional regulator n=1 Tax=Velocimicrobium porci TaxID=2606634 RepID=A0A6L5XZQ3_9FIRM|nr:helix-turn-helix transcriptional regulator [Velocimicrobium porci]